MGSTGRIDGPRRAHYSPACLDDASAYRPQRQFLQARALSAPAQTIGHDRDGYTANARDDGIQRALGQEPLVVDDLPDQSRRCRS